MTFNSLTELDGGMGSTLGDYKFLYGFVSLVKPKYILDIGTNRGLSAITMAMALRDAGLKQSRILSLDINAGYIEIAKKQINQLGLSHYINTFHGTSSDIDKDPFFNVVFIDGGHTYEECLLDFDNVKDRATYVLIHDATQFEGVAKLVKQIKEEGKHEIVNLDIGQRGEQWSLSEVVYRAYPGVAVVKVQK